MGITVRPYADEVLKFWFGTADVAGPIDPANMGRWFRKDPAFDAVCRERFGDLVDQAARGELSSWEASARGALALVILLDQFPRNLFRGDARTFASDPLARAVADRAIAHGFDREVSTLARGFFYLPYEHAEDLALQDRAVGLYEKLAVEAPPALAEVAASLVSYALKHREVIARFGRFPHRNAALGRDSTREETDFVQAGGGF